MGSGALLARTHSHLRIPSDVRPAVTSGQSSEPNHSDGTNIHLSRGQNPEKSSCRHPGVSPKSVPSSKHNHSPQVYGDLPKTEVLERLSRMPLADLDRSYGLYSSINYVVRKLAHPTFALALTPAAPRQRHAPAVCLRSQCREKRL